TQGKVLHRCFELREEICLFLDNKGKDTTQLRDERFLCEMAFLCDITSHLNAVNLQLQGRGRVISDMYRTVKAFQTKRTLWEAQMPKENRFADFEAPKSRFALLSNPFAVDVESSPPNLQMELVELQCNDALKANSAAVGAAEFVRFLPDTMPQLITQAAQTLSMFGSTYLCEQLFS
ncbi:unnamed protein product, partial [Tetraodon nigroviridis]